MKRFFFFLVISLSINSYSQTRHHVTMSGAGGYSGGNWENAKPGSELQNVINSANAGDEIWITIGTYVPTEEIGGTGHNYKTFTLKDSVKLLGGFCGGEQHVDDRNLAKNKTILSGDILLDDSDVIEQSEATRSDNSYHVVSISGAGDFSMDGFIISDGNANGSSNPSDFGGAIYIVSSESSSNITISNCIFSENAGKWGSCIAVNSGNNGVCSLQAIGCQFKNNSCNSGGGIYCLSQLNGSLTIDLSNCSFSGNAAAYFGGAINIENIHDGSVLATITNCTLSGNVANDGGAISLQSMSSNDLNATLLNSVIWENMDQSGKGTQNASIYNSGGILNTSDCLIEAYHFAGDLNGQDTSNHPLFIASVMPENAPSQSGSLFLSNHSPCQNNGKNSHNMAGTDLAGNARIREGTIDIGAYEVQSIVYIASEGKGNADGSSWSNAYHFDQLQRIIDKSYPGMQIWCAIGTYYPIADLTGNTYTLDTRKRTFIFKDGVELYGGFIGFEQSIEERDLLMNKSILSGDFYKNDNSIFRMDEPTRLDNSYHVITSISNDSTTILDGFLITGGNGNINNNPVGMGGGMLIDNYNEPHRNNITVRNCTFSKNSAFWGGAIYFNQVENDGLIYPSFLNCTFTNNLATYGGVAEILALTEGSCSPSFTNCLFYKNKAITSAGAIKNIGLFSSECAPEFINCTFANNTSQGNSGCFFNTSDGSSICTPRIYNSIIWNNSDKSGTGTDSSSFVNENCSPDLRHSLVEGQLLPGVGNLDGRLPVNHPDFISKHDSSAYFPLELQFCPSINSPCRNAGSNDYNSSSTDLKGLSRIHEDLIDIGAHEIVPRLYITENGAGSMNGSDWNNAFPGYQFQSAIHKLNINGELWVAKGLYRPSYDLSGILLTLNKTACVYQLKPNISILGGFNGTETQANQRSFADTTFISADQQENDNDTVPGSIDDNCNRLFIANKIDGSILLDGFCIKGANGINGGGIFYSNNAASTPSQLTISNCSFDQNKASSGAGLSIHLREECNFHCKIENSAFSNNTSAYGAGIYILAEDSNIYGNLKLKNCHFQLNSSQNNGGAIFGHSIDKSILRVIIDSCYFERNQAPFGLGGAISLSSDTKGNVFTIAKNNTFYHNTAMKGGSLFLSGTNSSNLNGKAIALFGASQVQNCLFAGNNAQAKGGAIAVENSNNAFTDLILTNNIYSGNIADTASSLWLNGTTGSTSYIKIQHCSFSNPSSNNSNALHIQSVQAELEASISHSVFYPDSFEVESTSSVKTEQNYFSQPFFMDIDGDDNIQGTPDDNFSPSACSPLIDQGKNDLLSVDFYGISRDSYADIGAIEFSGTKEKIVITKQPESKTCTLNSDVTLEIETNTSAVQYFWHKNGQLITSDNRISGEQTEGLTLSSIQTTDFGEYNCMLISSCDTIVSESALLSLNTGQSSAFEDESFLFYPSISSGQLFIVHNRDANISIYSLSGKKLKSFKIESYVDRINVSELSEGMYIIHYEAELFNYQQFFVIHK